MKLQDGFAEHPKVVGLSDGAFRLYVNALCYASRNETNGHIPAGAVKSLGGTMPRAAELFHAGLWEAPAEGDGWMIHDYLLHQRSREQINAEKEALKRRMQRHRNGDRNAVTSSDETLLRVRVQSKSTDPTTTTTRACAGDWYASVTKRQPENAVMREVLEAIDAAHPPECVEWAFTAAASKDAPWPFAKRLFDTCIVEGHGPRGKRETSVVRGNHGGGKRSETGPNSGRDSDRYAF